MTLRRILFWIHLSAGCVAGTIILVMCVTGVGLAFERQINNAADSFHREAVATGGIRLPIDQLAEAIPDRSGALTGIIVYSDPQQPLAFTFGREQTIFADPYSGKILGESSRRTRKIFTALERWHRALGNELRGPGPGRSLTGAANFAFLILIPTGLVLWLPRKWGRQQLRSSAMFRGGLSVKATLWNYHNVAGIWCALPLFLVALTGLIMSYGWANNALYRLSGSQPPPANGFAQQRNGHGTGKTVAQRQPLQVLFDRAENQVTDWRSITLRSTPQSREAVFLIDRGNGGQPNKRDQLTLDATTGQIRRWEPFANYPAGRRLRAWARFVHTGEAGGLTGQVIAAVATLGGAALVFTGLWMAILRLRNRLSMRSREHTLSSRAAKAS